MSEPFIAEIRIFAGNFAPRGWAFCDGQLLPVPANTALFSLIGTTYGGDGRTTTGLPNLQGRAPMHPGRGPGLTSRRLGERVGVETVTLSEAQMPAHNHTGPVGTDDEAESNDPTNRLYAVTVNEENYFENPTTAQRVNLASAAVANTGGSQAHTNLQPFLALSFIIALVGLFPARG